MRYFAYILLAGAIALRLFVIEERPFHTDEAVQAFQTVQLMDTGVYKYTPTDKHGPLLYFLTAGIYKLTGIPTAELAEIHFRLIPLFSSLLLGALLISLRSSLSCTTLLVTIGIWAIAPLMVIYQTYYVQEALFVLFGWMLGVSFYKWIETREIKYALFIGLSAGLMQTSKETSVIIYFSLIAAMIPIIWRQQIVLETLRSVFNPRTLIYVFAPFLVLYVVLFSSFFTHMQGLWDGIITYLHYFERAGGAGHEKPFGYYFGMFWLHRSEGVWWSELSILFLTSASWVYLTRKAFFKEGKPDIVWYLGTAGLIQFFVYSVIAYKTPWLMLFSYSTSALLIGAFMSELLKKRMASKIVAYALVLILALELVDRLKLSTGRYAADARNPYLYVHTVKPFLKLEASLREMIEQRNPTVAIVSADFGWPIPWYFREYDKMGYFTDTNIPEDLDVYIVDARLDIPPWLNEIERFDFEFHGLRPGVPMLVYSRKVTAE